VASSEIAGSKIEKTLLDGLSHITKGVDESKYV
jgi:hypothetical protein